MDFYNDIDAYGAKTAIISESSEYFTYSELLTVAYALKGHLKNKSLVFSVCENSLESIAGYIGFLRARVVPVLINDGINCNGGFTSLSIADN